MTQLFAQQRNSTSKDGLWHVAPEVAGLQTVLVNVYFVGTSENWVLIDAGIPMHAAKIIHAAERRFGRGTKPSAILLTHGHFDHVGSLHSLLRHWDVPVFAHHLEMPYLTGASDYPPPDPTVGGGLMARSAPLFPKHSYDFRPSITTLHEDGRVPSLPEWQWIHVPGHAPGQVAFFRDADRVLIAGDAFVTQKQESLLAVMTNAKKVHGPPMYFTCDWQLAEQSVRDLAGLKPNVAATGHGVPMSGDQLKWQLNALAEHFDLLGKPRHGRYVNTPVITDDGGVVSLPPRVSDPLPAIVAVVGVAAIASAIAIGAKHHKKEETFSERVLHAASPARLRRKLAGSRR